MKIVFLGSSRSISWNAKFHPSLHEGLAVFCQNQNFVDVKVSKSSYLGRRHSWLYLQGWPRNWFRGGQIRLGGERTKNLMVNNVLSENTLWRIAFYIRAVFTWLSKGIGFGFGFTTPFGWLVYLLWFWFYDSQVKTALWGNRTNFLNYIGSAVRGQGWGQ